MTPTMQVYGHLLVEHAMAASSNKPVMCNRIWEAIRVFEDLWPEDTKAFRDMYKPKKADHAPKHP